MSATLPPPEKRYFIDPENAAEMARLTHQDSLVTTIMGGLFPERSDLSCVRDVLDIACGPGEWPLRSLCRCRVSPTCRWSVSISVRS